MDFRKRYEKLNKAQRQAVDTIDGPVMVIAGPGTGKTELLSVRTANILQKTDILPENILCLTFTDSGAAAMRQRLTEIIGKEAYKVAIHTFHSFGSEIINQNGQYFYQGAHFRPANELSSYEIIKGIFKELEYNNPLSSKLNDEYTHQSDAQRIISEFKKSGFTSNELLSIIDQNSAVIEKVEQILSPIFSSGMSKTTAIEVAKYIEIISNYNLGDEQKLVVPLSKILADSLAMASKEAIELNSTKPMTAWRNEWFKKDRDGKFILKSHERQVKLRALCFIYEKYLNKMQEASLYDFDDMILRIVHAMETQNDLRFNLQEKYQYIMVDEFQDTNMAQMRILHNLTNNELAHGDTPNILVVGDDDQAIYSFQGADVSNIIDFRIKYPKAKLITLTNNYRSNEHILNKSRDIILQGNNRLENAFEDINKKLIAINNHGHDIELRVAETIADERNFVVNDIKSKIDSGIKPKDIAVLTRRHNEIDMLMPYFVKANIAVNYERRDNVLDLPPIILIEQLSNLLINLSKGFHDRVDSALPELLAHKVWGIPAIDLWRLSVSAYDGHTRWMNAMESDPVFSKLHNWLIEIASLVEAEPLEQILDLIIGKKLAKENTKVDEFISPIFEYFFSKDNLQNNPSDYLIYLESLRTIRSEVKEYRPNSTPTLITFIEYLGLNRKIGRSISTSLITNDTDNAISIMTAHKSKGLEFDNVYIINAVDNVWGEKARSRNRLISYPENLPLSPAGESADERLRLFYVAATRAKKHLNISYSLQGDNNKNTVCASFLVDIKMNTSKIDRVGVSQSIQLAELAWYQPIIKPTNEMRDLLLPKLDKYMLSITHLHSFLDITRGGPSTFLIQNLLHFPSAKSPNAAFGTAIHSTLQQAHSYIRTNDEYQAIEDIISDYEKNLANQHMQQIDYTNFLEKGSDALRIFLNDKYDTFNKDQITELNFANQFCVIDKAHITGKLDLVDIDRAGKTFIITDYKTGRSSNSWLGKDEFEKIKLHKYKQQLLFYKLLVENSRDFHGYKVTRGVMQFIEPSDKSEVISLDTDFTGEDFEKFKKLINSVWIRIKNMELPDISGYDLSYKGILAFEQDLIDNNI